MNNCICIGTVSYTHLVVNIVMFVYLFAIAMAQGGAICIGHLVGERKIHAAYLLGKYVTVSYSHLCVNKKTIELFQ